jgi:hypothetical protein
MRKNLSPLPLCLTCGKTVHKHRHKYCSVSCGVKGKHPGNYGKHSKVEARWAAGIYRPVELKKLTLDRDKHKCVLCGQGEKHNGKRLKLQIDHIDGDRRHNTLDNLRTLCPNCHTQTETFGYRGLCKGYKTKYT